MLFTTWPVSETGNCTVNVPAKSFWFNIFQGFLWWLNKVVGVTIFILVKWPGNRRNLCIPYVAFYFIRWIFFNRLVDCTWHMKFKTFTMKKHKRHRSINDNAGNRSDNNLLQRVLESKNFIEYSKFFLFNKFFENSWIFFINNYHCLQVCAFDTPNRDCLLSLTFGQKKKKKIRVCCEYL